MRRKRDFLHRDDWCLEGTTGAELLPEVGPEPGDVVFVKKKPSAFHGTPLLAYLIDRNIDTLVVVGGATSNCVRATVFDSASYNFRTIVPGRRGLRSAADLACDQPLRHGSSVRRR